MNWRMLRVQLWEIWRLTWVEYPVRILLPVWLMWFLLELMGGAGVFVMNFVFELVLLSSLVSMLWVNSFRQAGGSGYPFVLGFARPVSNVCLVLVPLAWLVLSNVMVYFALAVAFWAVSGVPCPGVAFIPVIVACSMVLAMICWATNRVLERAMAAAGFGALFLWWMAPRIARLDPLAVEAGRLVEIFRLSAPEYCVLLFVSAACGWLTVLFVGQQRCGDTGGILQPKRNRRVHRPRHPSPEACVQVALGSPGVV